MRHRVEHPYLHGITPPRPALARRALAIVASIGVTASALLIAQVPAQAAGVGKGEAIIRIDAARATVTKKSKGHYILTLPARSTGQWLGERTDARGKERVRVGDLTAEKLSMRWGAFRYQSSVLATLAWPTATGTRSALIRMSRPEITAKGVAVKFTKVSRLAIPATLTDASLNIRRADDNDTRDTVTNTIMTADFGYHFNLQDENAQSYGKFYNDKNGNDCWDTYMYASLTDPSQYTKTVPDKTCDSIEYNGQVYTYFTGPNAPPNTSNGEGYVNVELTPSGEEPFNYQQMVYTWYAGTN